MHRPQVHPHPIRVSREPPRVTRITPAVQGGARTAAEARLAPARRWTPAVTPRARVAHQPSSPARRTARALAAPLPVHPPLAEPASAAHLRWPGQVRAA